MTHETRPRASVRQSRRSAGRLKLPGLESEASRIVSLFVFASGLLLLVLAAAVYGTNDAVADIPPDAITPTPSGPAGPTPDLCQTPVDVSLVFDHSGSMSQNGKLPSAQQAASGFIDQ